MESMSVRGIFRQVVHEHAAQKKLTDQEAEALVGRLLKVWEDVTAKKQSLRDQLYFETISLREQVASLRRSVPAEVLKAKQVAYSTGECLLNVPCPSSSQTELPEQQLALEELNADDKQLFLLPKELARCAANVKDLCDAKDVQRAGGGKAKRVRVSPRTRPLLKQVVPQ